MKNKINPRKSTQTRILARRLYRWTMGHANKCWHVPGENLQISLPTQRNGIFEHYRGVLQRLPIRCFLQSSIFYRFGWIYSTLSGASIDLYNMFKNIFF